MPQIIHEFGDNTKINRDRFYDFYQRVTKNGELRIDLEELNKSLNIKIDQMPDSCKVAEIFEKMSARINPSKCKKNWSEEETIFFVWVIVAYCHLTHADYNDLVLKIPLSSCLDRLRLGLHLLRVPREKARPMQIEMAEFIKNKFVQSSLDCLGRRTLNTNHQ